MKKLVAGLFFTTVILALGTTGCSSGDESEGCSSNTDCTTLGANFVCQLDTRQCICLPACKDKCGGDDGCGGTCANNCLQGEVCDTETLQCKKVPTGCTTDADCASQGPNYYCNTRLGQCLCNPQCAGKCGGTDSCGGTCPDTCPQGQVCDTGTNTCKTDTCTPQCAGKCCGDDSCGGTCPDTCGNGMTCDPSSCACKGTTGCSKDADCASLGASFICDLASKKCICDKDKDGSICADDCDDNNPNVGPGKAEVCGNNIDDNCDTKIDCADSACAGLPECQSQCTPTDGVGDVCSSASAPCDCDNLCGELVMGTEGILNNYCYAECTQTGACGTDEVCVGFSETDAACLKTGQIVLNWKAKILAKGVTPKQTDITAISTTTSTLAGAGVTLNYAVGQEVDVPDASGVNQPYITLLLLGLSATEMWQLQVMLPKAKYIANTDLVRSFEAGQEPVADFDAYLLWVKPNGTVIEKVMLKAMSADGTLHIKTAPASGSTLQKADGTLTLNLLAFDAELPAN